MEGERKIKQRGREKEMDMKSVFYFFTLFSKCPKTKLNSKELSKVLDRILVVQNCGIDILRKDVSSLIMKQVRRELRLEKTSSILKHWFIPIKIKS